MSDKPKYTRLEYEEIEGTAIAAMVGLASAGQGFATETLAKRSFDIAEALLAERKARLGKKPEYSHGDN